LNTNKDKRGNESKKEASVVVGVLAEKEPALGETETEGERVTRGK
jgi:hypothetical protein